ncbi:hypothetical protein ACKGJO_13310 [Gracilimonas sp. Q87]|uniref:hypothetical protein n=1 Tax=Gracilimonas sp. Q87 TaxID=3384766 RepID=UPI0039843767
MMNSRKTKAQEETQQAGSAKRRCLFCGQEAELIWVHGHGQCAACGTNAEECCRGEQCRN